MKKQDSRPRVGDLKLKRETVRLLTLKTADLHNVMGGGIIKSGVMLVSRCCQPDD